MKANFFVVKTWKNIYPVVEKLFKKTVFNGIRFPQGRLFEDEYITYQLYYRSERIAVTDIVFYFYFTNPCGITKNLDAQ